MKTDETRKKMWGTSPLDYAKAMSSCAAERACSRDWKDHPMRGIEVCKDKWAVAYQEALQDLKLFL
jgi:hypothetical protein